MYRVDKRLLTSRHHSLFHLFAAFIFVTLFALGCRSDVNTTPEKPTFPDSTTHYQVEAQIHPDSGQFDVAIDMRFVPDEPTDTLRFLLHEALKLETLSGSAIDEHSASPWHFGGEDTVHTRVITLPLTRTATSSDPVSISWEYAGRIQNEQIPKIGGVVIDPQWTELPIEAMWVPVYAPISKRFTFDAKIDLPEDYEIASTGTLQRTSEGWHIQSPIPGPDVPLVISDQMQTRKYTDGSMPVTVYHGGAPDSLTGFVAQRAGQILDRYAQRFQGGNDAKVLRITLAPIERAISSSYARTGLISLKHDIEPDTSHYGLIAHEAAHLWWSDSVNPMSRHNFLNESFAVYESWLTLGETYGDSVFQEQLSQAQKGAREAPSFSEWSPGNDIKLSYQKGPVLLHELHERIGNDDFKSFVRALQQKDIGTLDGMVSTLREVTNDETAKWFQEKI